MLVQFGIGLLIGAGGVTALGLVAIVVGLIGWMNSGSH